MTETVTSEACFAHLLSLKTNSATPPECHVLLTKTTWKLKIPERVTKCDFRSRSRKLLQITAAFAIGGFVVRIGFGAISDKRRGNGLVAAISNKGCKNKCDVAFSNKERERERIPENNSTPPQSWEIGILKNKSVCFLCNAPASDKGGETKRNGAFSNGRGENGHDGATCY